MERALTLVATGTLTISLIRASKGKTIPLPKTINLSSGKESTRQTGFSDTAWGKETRSYAKSARSLPTAKFDIIIKEAREFMKPVRSRGNVSTEPIVIDDDDNERANLIDLSDGSDRDSTCMLPPLLTEFTNVSFFFRIDNLYVLAPVHIISVTGTGSYFFYFFASCSSYFFALCPPDHRPLPDSTLVAHCIPLLPGKNSPSPCKYVYTPPSSHKKCMSGLKKNICFI